MTDTGYDPNQDPELESLRFKIRNATAWLKLAFLNLEFADVTGRDKRKLRAMYDRQLKAVEDAWRAENDYMKRATK